MNLPDYVSNRSMEESGRRLDAMKTNGIRDGGIRGKTK